MPLLRRYDDGSLLSSTKSVPEHPGGLRSRDGVLVPPVLPRRQGDGATRRAVDTASPPRTDHGKRTFQRSPPRAPANVTDSALDPASPTRGRRHRGARRNRLCRQLSSDDAGRELRPVVEALGIWGTRWIGELGDEDLDPKLLLWDMHRRVDHSVVPEGKTVVHFAFSGVRGHSRNWWLVINSGEVDMCDIDPGFDVAVSVSAGLRQMTEIWRGNLTWSDAIRSGDVTISGPTALRRSLPSWFELSTFASIPRPA